MGVVSTSSTQDMPVNRLVGHSLTRLFAGRQVVKNEPLQITYSYWDGTGHRRKVVVRKGDTISQFLKAVKLQLSEEFRELRCGDLYATMCTDVSKLKYTGLVLSPKPSCRLNSSG